MYWITGATGMLGKELSLLLQKQAIEFIGTGHEIDITNKTAAENFAADKPISCIVNCAAYTAVDNAQDDAEKCFAINSTGTFNLAELAKKIGAKFIHISTDYVFNGKSKKPYVENDKTDPIGVYGRSKLEGEKKVLSENCNAYIIRTAWLYGIYGKNFVATMLKLMQERSEISVVNDQKGSPTFSSDLAKVILKIIDADNLERGIYHYTNEGCCTWAEFANQIYKTAKQLRLVTNECKIIPCSSKDYPSKVTRPQYSVLEKNKIKKKLKLDIPQWQDSLNCYLQELKEHK